VSTSVDTVPSRGTHVMAHTWNSSVPYKGGDYDQAIVVHACRLSPLGSEVTGSLEASLVTS
jgi:hypothetical protein